MSATLVRTAGAVDRHYYYSNQWQILEERKATNTYSERQFVWGIRYVDDLVFRDRDADGDGSHTLEERLYVLNDSFHVTAVTDTSATVQERYRYDAYGVPIVMTGSFGARADTIYDWETWYGAYRMDRETGLYQVRNRFLHSKLGRWLSRDPLGYEGGINLYTFVGDNPVNDTDADGRLPRRKRSSCVFWDARKNSANKCTSTYAAAAAIVCRLAGESPWEQCQRWCLQATYTTFGEDCCSAASTARFVAATAARYAACAAACLVDTAASALSRVGTTPPTPGAQGREQNSANSQT